MGIESFGLENNLINFIFELCSLLFNVWFHLTLVVVITYVKCSAFVGICCCYCCCWPRLIIFLTEFGNLFVVCNLCCVPNLKQVLLLPVIVANDSQWLCLGACLVHNHGRFSIICHYCIHVFNMNVPILFYSL